MRRPVPLIAFVLVVSCAEERAAPRTVHPNAGATVLKSEELAAIHCLVVAPFENGSDAPSAAEVATGALISEIDPLRTRVFPIAELRGMFRDTPLELPAGFGPSLALELAELVGADAVLYGSVEGRSRDAAPELLVTMRVSGTADHRLLFGQTILVRPATAERTDSAVRRAVLAAVRPALGRLRDTGKKRCFDPERTKELRKLALAQAGEARGSRVAAAQPPPRAAAPPPPPPPPAAQAEPRTPRQMDWAKRLVGGERIVLDEVTFVGRSTELQRDGGLADLAVALSAQPSVSIGLEGFVDLTGDHAADQKLSLAMAQVAAQRLADLGVARTRLSSVGRGSESPRLPNFTARGRAANRRIEVVGR